MVPPPLAPWQQRAVDQALAAWQAGRLGHGLLICGAEVLGQLAVAQVLARAMLADPANQTQMGSMASPPSASNFQPDVTSVTLMPNATGAKLRSEIVIEQIRQLTEQWSLTAHSGRTRIAIIHPADAMNHAASNALLKTLEEPVANRYIWLVSAHPMRLPATVRSRCQRLELKMPTRGEALAWLHTQGFAPQRASAALDASRGHPTLAKDWLSNQGMEFHQTIKDELAQLACGKVSVTALAQRWSGDDRCAARLVHAAAHALQLASTHWRTPQRAVHLANWFAAANRARVCLNTPLRPDLAMTELLLAWQTTCHAIACA